MPDPTPPLVLFEDTHVPRMGPLALLRPIYDLTVGGLTIRDRIERIAGRTMQASLLRTHLEGAGPQAAAADALYVNAAWLADEAVWAEVEALPPETLLLTGDDRVLALRSAGDRLPIAAYLRGTDEAPAGVTTRAASGEQLLKHAWDLLSGFEERLHADLLLLAQDFGPLAGSQTGAGVVRHGSRIYAGQEVTIEGPCVLDSRPGPIILSNGARVSPFSSLAGPLFLGKGTRILGGSVSKAYLGPHCKIRGELDSSIVLGWSNKAHDGFVGHSYLGTWVNLGALTTTSDLKNNYGIIRVSEPAAQSAEHAARAGEATRLWPEAASGMIKLGSFLADHTKTAIGTLLGAGSVVGVGTNLFGPVRPAPKWMPSFAWGTGPDTKAYDLELFIETVKVVYDRRGLTLTPTDQRILESVHELTRAERAAYLQSEKE